MPNLKQDLEKVDTVLADSGPDDKIWQVGAVLNEKLGIKTAHAKEFLRIALANTLLMDRKQLDYGPHNITKGGVFGCVLRSSDKFERVFNLYNNRRGRAVNESIHDSFRDISNYMIIALMLELERWPND